MHERLIALLNMPENMVIVRGGSTMPLGNCEALSLTEIPDRVAVRLKEQIKTVVEKWNKGYPHTTFSYGYCNTPGDMKTYVSYIIVPKADYEEAKAGNIS